MAGPEKNLYKMVKDKLADFNPIRIETTTINGFPDLILFNKNKQVLFLECKVCERYKLLQSLRPHQKPFTINILKFLMGFLSCRGCFLQERFFCIGQKIKIF